MALNIKNEEVHRLAKRLADDLGVSMTEAIRIALENQLQDPGEIEVRRRKLTTIVKEIRGSLTGLPSQEEIEAELYDENGLPK